MADKFLKVGANGFTTEVNAPDVATPNSVISTLATGRLDPSLMPLGIGADTKLVVASEALAAGDLVNIYDNAGTLNARKADRSNGRECHGFVNAAVASGAQATVLFEGALAKTGLTIGRYWLGLAGALENAPTTTSGHLLQYVGFALSTTELTFEADTPITRA